jgi:hypothetical protein
VTAPSEHVLRICQILWRTYPLEKIHSFIFIQNEVKSYKLGIAIKYFRKKNNNRHMLRVKLEHIFLVKSETGQAPVTHTCNPSYSGGRNQEDRSSKPAQANGLWKPILNKKGWWNGSRCWPWVQILVLQKIKVWKFIDFYSQKLKEHLGAVEKFKSAQNSLLKVAI